MKKKTATAVTLTIGSEKARTLLASLQKTIDESIGVNSLVSKRLAAFVAQIDREAGMGVLARLREKLDADEAAAKAYMKGFRKAFPHSSAKIPDRAKRR